MPTAANLVAKVLSDEPSREAAEALHGRGCRTCRADDVEVPRGAVATSPTACARATNSKATDQGDRGRVRRRHRAPRPRPHRPRPQPELNRRRQGPDAHSPIRRRRRAIARRSCRQMRSRRSPSNNGVMPWWATSARISSSVGRVEVTDCRFDHRGEQASVARGVEEHLRVRQHEADRTPDGGRVGERVVPAEVRRVLVGPSAPGDRLDRLDRDAAVGAHCEQLARRRRGRSGCPSGRS